MIEEFPCYKLLYSLYQFIKVLSHPTKNEIGPIGKLQSLQMHTNVIGLLVPFLMMSHVYCVYIIYIYNIYIYIFLYISNKLFATCFFQETFPRAFLKR